MADILNIKYINELVMAEKGKPTELKRYLVAYDYGKTLCRAYLGTSMTVGGGGAYEAIADETPTKVPLDTESFDLGSNFASYKFTAPVTGYYQFNWGASITNAGSVIYNAFASIYVNGAEKSRGTRPYNSGAAFALIKSGGSDLIYMTAGQYAELYAYANTSDNSACVVTAGSHLTFMSVYLVST